MSVLRDEIRHSLRRRHASMTWLACRSFIEEWTLRRRMKNTNAMRIDEIYSIGRALKWSPETMAAIIAADYAQKEGGRR